MFELIIPQVQSLHILQLTHTPRQIADEVMVQQQVPQGGQPANPLTHSPYHVVIQIEYLQLCQTAQGVWELCDLIVVQMKSAE